MRGCTNLDVALIVFSRAPLAGRVKTRLVPRLGTWRATRLHRRLTEQALATARGAGCGPVYLYSTAAHSLLPGARLQRGMDLGERMERALAAALRRHRAAILIGADCPALGAGHLRRAARWLAGGCEAVLGPAEDGGYVLIGVRRIVQPLFHGIDWGSSNVFAQTAGRLGARRWRALEPLWDVDRPEELQRIKALRLPSAPRPPARR